MKISWQTRFDIGYLNLHWFVNHVIPATKLSGKHHIQLCRKMYNEHQGANSALLKIQIYQQNSCLLNNRIKTLCKKLPRRNDVWDRYLSKYVYINIKSYQEVHAFTLTWFIVCKHIILWRIFDSMCLMHCCIAHGGYTRMYREIQKQSNKIIPLGSHFWANQRSTTLSYQFIYHFLRQTTGPFHFQWSSTAANHWVLMLLLQC